MLLLSTKLKYDEPLPVDRRDLDSETKSNTVPAPWNILLILVCACSSVLDYKERGGPDTSVLFQGQI